MLVLNCSSQVYQLNMNRRAETLEDQLTQEFGSIHRTHFNEQQKQDFEWAEALAKTYQNFGGSEVFESDFPKWVGP